jgi:hypothetical protein
MSLSSRLQGQSKFGRSKLFPVSSTFGTFNSASNFHYKANSANYLAGVWNKAHFTASITDGLPGHVSIYAPNPKTLLSHVPSSHMDCVRSFTLVPAEECIPIKHIFGKVHAIPAWCVVTKRGRYNGDLGYMISFNAQSSLCDILVASRDLHPR